MARSIVTALVALACGGESGWTGAAVVADSAGIAIVTNYRAEWGSEARWRVADSPELSIGVMDGGPEYTFDRIVGAASLSDGTNVVADMGSSQVRLYDASGNYLRAIGRAGPGPGEFRQITALFRIADDLLAVQDRIELVNLYRRDGTFLGSHRTGTMPVPVDPVTLQLSPVTVPPIVGWLDESTYVTAEHTPVKLSPTHEFRAPETVQVVVRRGRVGGDTEEILRTTGPTYHPHPMNLVLPAVFGPSVHIGTHASGLIVASSEEGEVRWFGPEGRLTRVSRLPGQRDRVTPAMIEEYVQRSVPPLRENLARARTFAQVLPAFSALATDASGYVWLRRYDAVHGATLAQYIPTYDRPSTWAVLAPDGRWLGDIRLPARFSPLEIGNDHILGVYRDENDVEYVRRYRIHKPTGTPGR
jgi:hypothetical protein